MNKTLKFNFSANSAITQQAAAFFLLFITSMVLLLIAAPALAAEPVSTSAAGAIVIDAQTGEVYYEKNPDTARPIASMTKVMSVYLIFEEIEAGNLSLDTPITISQYAASISNNPSYSGMEHLQEGATYTVDTLLRLVLTSSCSASTIAMAEHVGGSHDNFVNMMNAKAQEWGIAAQFVDCVGYRPNAVTPRAMAEIARHCVNDHPQILEYSSLTSTNFQNRTFYSTNTLLRNGSIPGLDGLKTGTTSRAGCCFTGTAARDGRRIISVVMGSPNTSVRMSDTRKLIEYGFTRRAELEKSWSQNINVLNCILSVDSGSVLPFAENKFQAEISGGSANPIPCTLTWELGGQSYPGGTLMLTENSTAYLNATPPAVDETLSIALNITFPDGHSLRQTGSLPVLQQPLTFSGAIGVTSATLYQGMRLDIPCVIHCDQNINCNIPVGWYLNGQPLTDYQNQSFACTPNGSSTLSLNTKDLTPGLNVLEFYCNPYGLPGMEKTSFTAELNVLSLPTGLTPPTQAIESE